jgi:hypothetical protein
VTKRNVGIINANNTTTFYMFGPRYSYRSESRFTRMHRLCLAERLESQQTTRRVHWRHIPVFPVVNPQSLFPGADTEITAQ